jgi:hypothetical protein
MNEGWSRGGGCQVDGQPTPSEDGWETEATDEPRANPEFGMLMAPGWLQEELVAALES